VGRLTRLAMPVLAMLRLVERSRRRTRLLGGQYNQRAKSPEESTSRSPQSSRGSVESMVVLF
jgi:hypothetical protein